MNYVPVRLSTIKPSTTLNFDVYIKLPHKFLLYVKDGDDIDVERLTSLKKKKVRKLFIEDCDEEKYQQFLDDCLNSLATDENASDSDKANVVKGVAEDASEEIYQRPESQEAYKAAKRASSGLVKLLSGNDEVLKAILAREGSASPDMAERMHMHGVNSSSLAIRFGEFMGLDQEVLEDLGIAALYHDVGFSKVSQTAQEFFFKNLKEEKPIQLTEYRTHPKVAVELLQDKEFASKQVMDLIYTHEEKVSGEGFPQKLTNLTPIQEIHSLCCYYDRRITCVGENPIFVIDDIMISEVGNYNLQMLKKFKAFMKNIEKPS